MFRATIFLHVNDKKVMFKDGCECAPNILGQIPFNRACYMFHMPYWLKLKNVRHKLNCMHAVTLSCTKKRIMNFCNVTYDIKSCYLICINSGHKNTIQKNMQTRTLSMLIPAYSNNLSWFKWDFSLTNVGLPLSVSLFV